MSNEDIIIPDSIKDCLPCQENAITSTLITVCNLSKELQSTVDCEQLSKDIINGVKTKQDVISEIALKSKGTSVEHTVDKILNVLKDSIVNNGDVVNG